TEADLQMLGRLLKVLHERPHYNLSHLIGYWRGIYGADETEKLAKIAGNDLLQATNALTQIREDKPVKADYDSIGAFKDCMAKLREHLHRKMLSDAHAIAHQTDFRELTPEQKAQIKASLLRKDTPQS
ncbi:MAG: DNA primase, partial [Moraxellaceae bacterium]